MGYCCVKKFRLNLENYFIQEFQNKYIGDDAALIGDYGYSKDAFFENVHFKTKWMSYYQIASKAMMVNISDAIAMNAKPKYALLSVAMPKDITKAQMRELAAGFKDVARKYNIDIIGGDTICNTKLDITVTIISKTKKPLFRSGIRTGYSIAYTGELGRSRKDLQKLLNLGKIHSKSKFVNITLRELFISKTQRLLRSGMDISDGLFSDLEKFSKVNKTGFYFYKKIPKSIGCSGEEYEMLVAFDKRDTKAVLRHACASRTKLNIIAKSTRGRYENRCTSHHF